MAGHRIAIEIDVRTAQRGEPLETAVPSYEDALAEAYEKAQDQAEFFGLRPDLVSLRESELVRWDDPTATIRFVFIWENSGE